MIYALAFQIADVRQVSVLLIEVQTITYDELIAYGHRYVVYIILVEELVGLEEERADRYTRGLTLLEVVKQIVHAMTRLDDILDDDNILTLNIEVDA